ncbi:MAG: translation initiation factor IF-3 [Ruminococcaceae bacterium]|nr:translation initiation factor IF-3 [Oscillospiraceae bacterium]
MCGEFFSAHFFRRCFNISAKELLINEEIKADKVRVIAGDGSQLGIMSKRDALAQAYDAGLDLVEMSPNAEPPVCKIMDYGKFLFERTKKEKESKKKRSTVELKEIKFSCRIDKHDFDTKINHARRFLTDGNKVKVTIVFSGREMNHTDRGYDLMSNIREALVDVGGADKAPSLDGRFITLVLSPKKSDEK